MATFDIGRGELAYFGFGRTEAEVDIGRSSVCHLRSHHHLGYHPDAGHMVEHGVGVELFTSL